MRTNTRRYEWPSEHHGTFAFGAGRRLVSEYLYIYRTVSDTRNVPIAFVIVWTRVRAQGYDTQLYKYANFEIPLGTTTNSAPHDHTVRPVLSDILHQPSLFLRLIARDLALQALEACERNWLTSLFNGRPS